MIYRNISGVVLYHPYEFCPNRWFWLVVMATERLNLRRKKIFFSEAIRGMKLKLCIHVHDITLYINCIFIVVAHVLSLLWQLKVSYTYNGKSGNWHLFLCYCRYFGKSFTENVSGVVLYQPYEFCPNHWFWSVAMATERLNFRKNKSSSQKLYSLHSCTFRWALWPMGHWFLM